MSDEPLSDHSDNTPAAFDAQRLMHDLRRGDPKALALAFHQLFDTGIGRLVLASHLAECGVGNPLGGPGMTDADLRYAVGRHDAAIMLAARVYDPAALAVATLTGELEENPREHDNDLQGEFAGGFGAVGDDDDIRG